jgi:SnoaL-like domain
MDDPGVDVQEIADRLEIGELLARYVRAVDGGEWALLDSVFTEDATIDFSATGGVRGDREAIKRWLAEVLAAWPGRQHLIGAATMSVDGDEARVSASFADTLAPSRSTVAATEPGFIRGGGWYHHRLIRTPDGWRSRELIQEQSWRTFA